MIGVTGLVYGGSRAGITRQRLRFRDTPYKPDESVSNSPNDGMLPTTVTTGSPLLNQQAVNEVNRKRRANDQQHIDNVKEQQECLRN